MMKKLFLYMLMLLIGVTTSACGSDSDTVSEPPVEEEEGGSTETDNGRYLVLYCSRTGNTESMAQAIHTALGCDIMEISPETPYDENYNAMLDRARAELDAISQGNYPPITTTVENLNEYDMIFIGYPIWYGHMATPMQTFLHDNASRLAGKRLALFATSGSSGMSTSINEARSLVPEASFTETLHLTSSTIDDMNSGIQAWLEQLGATNNGNTDEDESPVGSFKVNIIVGNSTITATMEDNGAARDFMSRLPLEVTLEDYNNGTEKIFYPEPALSLDDTPRGCAPVPGDITIYEPWGNVAIFCREWSESGSLIKIGHIDGDGINALIGTDDVRVRFEQP